MMYKIGEVAEMLGFSVSTLKLWNKNGKFLPTTTTQAGDRLYSKEDIIDFCKKSGRELNELNFYTKEELMEMIRKMRE